MEKEQEKPEIIYAEDYNSIRLTMGLLLGEEYSIKECSDGNGLKNELENIVKNGAGNTKAILTDNEMPGCNGSELIAEYANKEDMPPMILLYGGVPEIGKKAVEDGAYAYLIKPASPKKITDKISEAIKKYSQ